jgi:glycosyltransferase involved in cell wall biosynthesis
LALRALARVKSQGVKFRYRFCGGGPDAGAMRELAASLGLREEAFFDEALSGTAYRAELAATHIYLLPSFRESTGLTMMEAMLAGCVPVVADCGGPAGIVTSDCGYKIAVTTAEQMTGELADAIVAMDRQRDIIRQKGSAAAERIATAYSESNYRKVVGAVYASMVTKPLWPKLGNP